MIREATARPLDFEPGTQFRYCNLGYTLLGEIIEVQTGGRYADYIKQSLLDPVGMDNSQIHDERYIPTLDDAVGLRWDDQLGCHVRDEVVSLPVTPADGGLVTTLDDFARWVTVYKFMEHPKLSNASFERMLAQAAPADTYRWPERNMRGQGFYGLGLMRSGDLAMHEGSIVGFRSFFLYSRDDDLLITVFSNNTYNDVFRIASGLFELYS
jgi:CubicO group peptidase (beta-lactamase class C family)